MYSYAPGPDQANLLDAEDQLASYREEFIFPTDGNGHRQLYFCSNSLGLQPKSASSAVAEVLADWGNLGVKGHFAAEHAWVTYHELLTQSTANLVGALPHEVVVMNSVTINLHLMLVSFFRPTGARKKILIEAQAFPSDRYAVESHLLWHGLDPAECLVEVNGEPSVGEEDIIKVLETQGDQIALIVLGNPNYYTGCFLDMGLLTRYAHRHGCMIGFDCAHGIANLPLDLHDAGCDFAIWCSYKYLCSGPGSPAGLFIHERHEQPTKTRPRFAGWWGHDKDTRFEMSGVFKPIPGAEGWQLSNQPILAMAATRCATDLVSSIGMEKLREKSKLLTGYLEFLLNAIDSAHAIKVITPTDPERRGCQLSLEVQGADKRLFDYLSQNGIVADWREPAVIRIAPSPLYNSFSDVWHFSQTLRNGLSAVFNSI